jgi:hypothetical protein
LWAGRSTHPLGDSHRRGNLRRNRRGIPELIVVLPAAHRGKHDKDESTDPENRPNHDPTPHLGAASHCVRDPHQRPPEPGSPAWC